MENERRVALVTGANRGIGFEIVRQLACRGLWVFLTARDATRGRIACERLAREGLRVDFERLDVADPQSIDAAVARVGARAGRLDVLVNNAAVRGGSRDTLLDTDLDSGLSTINTNFLGALRAARASVPWMRRHDYGRIVNVSSGRGSFAQLAAGVPFYRLSKAAMNAMTVILADELRDTGILVNAMTPGWVRTRLVRFRGPRTVEEGAGTAVWLATLPDGGPTGKFFKDQQEFPW